MTSISQSDIDAIKDELKKDLTKQLSQKELFGIGNPEDLANQIQQNPTQKTKKNTTKTQLTPSPNPSKTKQKP